MEVPQVLDLESEAGCFAAVDGMGGEAGGEIAARIVASSFFAIRRCNVSMKTARRLVESCLMDSLRTIAEIGCGKPVLRSMGAAVAGVFLCADGALVFCCGDCRVYRRDGGKLVKLSHEQSVVQDLCDAGVIDEEGMRLHSQKHILNACVSGSLEYFDIRFKELPSGEENRPGFVICSDGVWEALSRAEIEECLPKEKGLGEAGTSLAERLIGLGEKCRDNVTFILIE